MSEETDFLAQKLLSGDVSLLQKLVGSIRDIHGNEGSLSFPHMRQVLGDDKLGRFTKSGSLQLAPVRNTKHQFHSDFNLKQQALFSYQNPYLPLALLPIGTPFVQKKTRKPIVVRKSVVDTDFDAANRCRKAMADIAKQERDMIIARSREEADFLARQLESQTSTDLRNKRETVLSIKRGRKSAPDHMKNILGKSRLIAAEIENFINNHCYHKDDLSKTSAEILWKIQTNKRVSTPNRRPPKGGSGGGGLETIATTSTSPPLAGILFLEDVHLSRPCSKQTRRVLSIQKSDHSDPILPTVPAPVEVCYGKGAVSGGYKRASSKGRAMLSGMPSSIAMLRLVPTRNNSGR